MSELQTASYEYKPKKLNLFSDIIDPVYLEYQHVAQKKNLDFKIVNQAPETMVNVDEYSVTQIFANIFDNALKYTEKGKIDVNLKNENKKLCVEITDTGIGISQEYQKNLFKPFIQEEQGYTRKFEGNGLGLALVKKYCELNNVDISVVSQKGKGSSFILTFPI